MFNRAAHPGRFGARTKTSHLGTSGRVPGDNFLSTPPPPGITNRAAHSGQPSAGVGTVPGPYVISPYLRRPEKLSGRHTWGDTAREPDHPVTPTFTLCVFRPSGHIHSDGTPGTARRVNRTVPTELLLLFFSLRVSGRLRYDAGGASGRTRRTNRLCPFCSHFFRRPERLSHLAWAVHPGRPGAGTGAALAIVSLSSNAPFQPSACTARTARPDETGA